MLRGVRTLRRLLKKIMTAVLTILETVNKFLANRFQSLLSILVLICMIWYLAASWYSSTNRLKNVEADVVDVKADVVEIKRDVVEIKKEIRSLDVRVSRLEEKVDHLETRMEKLEQKVDDIRVDVKAILILLSAKKNP